MISGQKDFVLRIYDAVADNSRWPVLLQEFADHIGAVGCIIWEWEGAPEDRRMTAPISSSFYDPGAIGQYIEKCFEHEAEDHDKFEAHSLRADGIDLIEDDVIAENPDALLQRQNVATLQKLGIFHRAAGLLNKDNTQISRFSLQLPVGRGRLNEAEHHYVGQILPHVAKALDLARPAQALARAHSGLLAALDRLVVGVCVLDAQGRVVVRNDEFRRQEEVYRIFRVTDHGKLAMARDTDQLQFRTLKADALNHGRFGARPRKEAVATDAGSHLCIEVTPLNHAAEIGTRPLGGYLVYSTDTASPVRCNIAAIRHAYGLTDAELEIVEAVAEGLTNAQIAERRDRAVATVNAQVKSILSKTQCTNRTQFVRLMMSFGADYLRE